MAAWVPDFHSSLSLFHDIIPQKLRSHFPLNLLETSMAHRRFWSSLCLYFKIWEVEYDDLCWRCSLDLRGYIPGSWWPTDPSSSVQAQGKPLPIISYYIFITHCNKFTLPTGSYISFSLPWPQASFTLLLKVWGSISDLMLQHVAVCYKGQMCTS